MKIKHLQSNIPYLFCFRKIKRERYSSPSQECQVKTHHNKYLLTLTQIHLLIEAIQVSIQSKQTYQ